MIKEDNAMSHRKRINEESIISAIEDYLSTDKTMARAAKDAGMDYSTLLSYAKLAIRILCSCRLSGLKSTDVQYRTLTTAYFTSRPAQAARGGATCSVA